MVTCGQPSCLTVATLMTRFSSRMARTLALRSPLAICGDFDIALHSARFEPSPDLSLRETSSLDPRHQAAGRRAGPGDLIRVKAAGDPRRVTRERKRWRSPMSLPEIAFL